VTREQKRDGLPGGCDVFAALNPAPDCLGGLLLSELLAPEM
jgi:hypothetical protein